MRTIRKAGAEEQMTTIMPPTLASVRQKSPKTRARTSSMTNMSREKRLRTTPCGVSSKKSMGERITAANMRSCMWRAARITQRE